MDNQNEQSLNIFLWNKYEKLQKKLSSKVSYYQNKIQYFKDFWGLIDKHEVDIKLLNNEYKKKRSSKLEELFDLIGQSYVNYLKSHKNYLVNIINNLDKYITESKKEKPLYNDFKQIIPSYNLQQKKYIQIKEKYHEIAIEVENKVLKEIKKKDSLEISKRLKEKTETNLKKYELCIDETNKIIKEYNSKQNDLIGFYINIKEFALKMYYSILDDYFTFERDKTIQFFCSDKNKKLQEKNSSKDIKRELKENLMQEANIEKPDKEIIFEQHKSNIDFENCMEKEDYKKYVKIVKFIEKNYGVKFSNINLEKEKIKNDLRELIREFFELDSQKKEISEKDKNKYFNYLKQPFTLFPFVKVLSKLRTNKKFNRGKNLIELLGDSFKIILEDAEKNKNYWAAKNCLILSQTYFFEEEDQNTKTINKKYPFEYIKKETWLSKKEFWIGYCLYMVKEELKKFANIFPDVTFDDIEKNKDFNKKINTKLSDILFSQILPILTNMLEVTKDKMYVVEIIEFFHEKYIYLNKDKIESLYKVISDNKEEIEQMRKEYKSNKEQNFINTPNKTFEKEKNDKNYFHNTDKGESLNKSSDSYKNISDSDYESSSKQIVEFNNVDKNLNSKNNISNEMETKDNLITPNNQGNQLEEKNNIKNNTQINQDNKEDNDNNIQLYKNEINDNNDLNKEKKNINNDTEEIKNLENKDKDNNIIEDNDTKENNDKKEDKEETELKKEENNKKEEEYNLELEENKDNVEDNNKKIDKEEKVLKEEKK